MKRQSKQAFTLIELLVVIAVIAVLAAILFPVFAQARERARQSMCLSNLKQIGAATMMYIQDFNETYPGNSSDFWIPGPEGRWDYLPVKTFGGTQNIAPFSMAVRLLPYIKSAPIFLCPNNPTGKDRAGLLNGKEAWDTRYTRSGYGWQNALSYGYTWPTFPTGTPKQSGQPLKLAEVSKPALLQMVIDGFMHSRFVAAEARQNLAFADGHAKFSRYVDWWVPQNQRPWIWNSWNPAMPVDVEKSCSPTCAEEAVRD